MSMQPSVAPGTSVTWQGTTYKMLVTGHTTGRLGIFESLAPPEAGPPRHVHHAEDETFYILSGEAIFWTETETRTAGPGEVVHIPRGTPHTFHVVGPNPARWVTILTPGGGEAFFAEMAAGDYRIPQDMPEIVRIAQRYSLEFVGPPLKS